MPVLALGGRFTRPDHLVTTITCRGGQTQIGRVLRHIRSAAGQMPLKALIYVGDAMEGSIDDLSNVAGELGLLGVKAFLFLRYTRGEDGRLLITPECTSFEEIEGQIDSLQDEMDELRERARRAFQVA